MSERKPKYIVKKIGAEQRDAADNKAAAVEEKAPDIAMTAVFYKPKTWKPVCPVKAGFRL